MASAVAFARREGTGSIDDDAGPLAGLQVAWSTPAGRPASCSHAPGHSRRDRQLDGGRDASMRVRTCVAAARPSPGLFLEMGSGEGSGRVRRPVPYSNDVPRRLVRSLAGCRSLFSLSPQTSFHGDPLAKSRFKHGQLGPVRVDRSFQFISLTLHTSSPVFAAI